MSVYVDRLRPVKPTAAWPWPYAAHLTADSPEELHAFAGWLGLKKEWFQDHPRHPHYDLTVTKHLAAKKRGAVEIGKEIP